MTRLHADAQPTMLPATTGLTHRRVPRVDGAKVLHCETLTPPTNGGVCTYAAGTSSSMRLMGTVLGVNTIYEGGEVIIDDFGFIVYSGCAADRPAELDALAESATTAICADGVISPGLINAHTHTGYDSHHPYQSADRYNHRNDWRPILPPPGVDRWSYQLPHQNVYSELRHAMAGVTASVSGSYIAGTVLNLDVLVHPETGQDLVQWNTFPLESGGDYIQNDGPCSDFPKYSWYPAYVQGAEYVPHVAEGINDAAHNEFSCLSTFMDRGWTILHGIATTALDGQFMAEQRIGLVWSPRSNISLYGNTAQVRMLRDEGVLISLGSDWSPTGSLDMKRELACADAWNRKYLDRAFTDRELWLMTTYNPALSLGVDAFIGQLEAGSLAQVVVFDGRGKDNPYRAVIDGDAGNTVLVIVGDLFAGDWPQTTALYGDLAFLTALGAVDSPIVAGCEPYAEPMFGRSDVCGTPKFVCTNRPEVQEFFRQPTTNPLDPTGPDVPYYQAYSMMLALYGLPPVTEYDLASFETLSFHNWLVESYPLVYCGEPDQEPSCTPMRPGEYDGTNATGPASRSDRDGDGITDNRDNCKKVFNPIRPMDNGVQPDTDGDGVGDACDRCPLVYGDDCDSIDPHNPIGACCHPTTYADPATPGTGGLCEDWVDETECESSGGVFHYYRTCDSLMPTCGNPGACCLDNPPPGEDPPGVCSNELEALCSGRFLTGMDCSPDPFDPPCGEFTACPHTITMWDDYGDGWTSGYLDVYVNGTLVATGITLLSGYGPETATFPADTGDTIEIVWIPGNWGHEASYCVTDGTGNELGCDGLDGTEPVGITLTGYCEGN